MRRRPHVEAKDVSDRRAVDIETAIASVRIRALHDDAPVRDGWPPHQPMRVGRPQRVQRDPRRPGRLFVDRRTGRIEPDPLGLGVQHAGHAYELIAMGEQRAKRHGLDAMLANLLLPAFGKSGEVRWIALHRLRTERLNTRADRRRRHRLPDTSPHD